MLHPASAVTSAQLWSQVTLVDWLPVYNVQNQTHVLSQPHYLVESRYNSVRPGSWAEAAELEATLPPELSTHPALGKKLLSMLLSHKNPLPKPALLQHQSQPRHIHMKPHSILLQAPEQTRTSAPQVTGRLYETSLCNSLVFLVGCERLVSMTQAHPNGGKTERKRIKLSFPQNRCKPCSSQLGNISVSRTSRHSPSRQAAMHFLKNASHLYLKPTRIILAELFFKKKNTSIFSSKHKQAAGAPLRDLPSRQVEPTSAGTLLLQAAHQHLFALGSRAPRSRPFARRFCPGRGRGTGPRVSAPGGGTHGSLGTGVSSAPPCPSQPR